MTVLPMMLVLLVMSVLMMTIVPPMAIALRMAAPMVNAPAASRFRRALLALPVALAVVLAPAGRADEGADRALTRGIHDVVADTVNLALRNETSFGIGKRNRTANLTVLEPSFLSLIGDTWGLAHQFHLPLVWHPEVVARYGGTYGLGDLGYELYLAAPAAEGLSLGGGLSLLLPSASDKRLGEGKWAMGPAVSVGMSWGALALSVAARQHFTLVSERTAPDVNRLTLQPSLTWALRSGWYLVSAPVLKADWKAASSERFTIPVGGGIGKIATLGGQKLALTLQGYFQAAPRTSTPHADWTLRAGLSLLYPR